MSDYTQRKSAERGKSYWRQVGETVVVAALVCGVVVILALLGVIH